MLKIFQFLAVAVLICVSPAQAEDYIKSHVPDAQLVGQGRLRVYFMNVYDAQLLAPKGDLSEGKPFALRLSYLRDIPGHKISGRSMDEIKDQERWSADQLTAWDAKMQKIFPDVKQGDTITGVYTKSGETVFYKGGEEIGRVSDKAFGQAFFDIWLSENTTVPDLRRKLLGASS